MTKAQFDQQLSTAMPMARHFGVCTSRTLSPDITVMVDWALKTNNQSHPQFWLMPRFAYL